MLGGQSACAQRGSPGVVPPVRPMLYKQQQQGVLLAQQCTDTNLQSVSKYESQMLLRVVDSNNEEVCQWQEAQGEWDVGDHGRKGVDSIS